MVDFNFPGSSGGFTHGCRCYQAPQGLAEQLHELFRCPFSAEMRHWLEKELYGYQKGEHLPWYRVIPCRQRGLFLHPATNRQQTRPIRDSALNQRTLAEIKYLYAHQALDQYLSHHFPHVEPWPEEIRLEYQEELIPGYICLNAWKEPIGSIESTLQEGIERMLKEYLPSMSREMDDCGQSLKVIHHRHWQI